LPQRGSAAERLPAAVDRGHLRLPAGRAAHRHGRARRPDRTQEAPPVGGHGVRRHIGGGRIRADRGTAHRRPRPARSRGGHAHAAHAGADQEHVPRPRATAHGRRGLGGELRRLSLAAVLPTVYGIKQVAGGGKVMEIAGAIALGLLFTVVFVRRQRSLSNPMLDLRLFGDRGFGVFLLTGTLAIFALVGVFYFVSQYLQMVLGLRPFVAGVFTLPAAVMALIGALLAASIVKRFRPGPTIAAGMLVTCAGFAVLAQVRPGSPDVILLLGLALLGGGVGVVQAIASDLVVAVAPPQRAGSASAVLEAATEMGGALGVAVLG